MAEAVTDLLPPAAVLILARAPRPGKVRRALEPMLTSAGCAALERALLTATARWAADLAPGRVFVAYEPADAGEDLARLLAADHFIPQIGDGLAARVGDAAGRVFARHDGPLLIVWPELAGLGQERAAAALDDLRNGCELSVGPTFDGNVYLLALRQALRPLFAISEEHWRGGRLLPALFALGTELPGGQVGMLRAERALRGPADVRAALADPLLDEGLRAILERRR